MREEVVLGLLAVVVHAVPQDREVDLAFLKEQIILVMTVSVNKGRHTTDQAFGIFELLQK